MNPAQVFTFKIGGMAGQGVKAAGLILAKIATRSGYHIYTHTEYPSLVRGGHNVMQISISKAEVNAAFKPTQLLIALDQQTIDLHFEELVENAIVIYDADRNLNTDKIPANVHICPIPLLKIVKDNGGIDIMSNTVAIAASLAFLGADIKFLKDLLSEEFARKGQEVIDLNHTIAQTGFDYAKEHFGEHQFEALKPKTERKELMVINGNQAAAVGAITAGLQYAAIYPMTPTSNILHVLAPLQDQYGFIYKQPEDEIAAIHMGLGASFAGARSMVATSGGGFCLMTEAYGLGALTETPLVIIEGMRSGPATGMPTWTEQGDLQFVLHAHQGDIPRIVLAAGDAKEIFELTIQAFNLADKYQTPVILLVDKHICENDQSYEPFDTSSYQIDRGNFTREKVEGYQRYNFTENGISQRSIPGSGNHVMANSDEHDPQGYSNDDIPNRNAMVAKRAQKIVTCQKEDMPEPQFFGPEEAQITIVSWGSNKGAILEALKSFDNVNFLHLTWMNPFPVEAVTRILHKAKYILNIECNQSAQMAQLIRTQTGIQILDNMLKYDGRPIYPEEIGAKLNQIMGK